MRRGRGRAVVAPCAHRPSPDSYAMFSARARLAPGMRALDAPECAIARRGFKCAAPPGSRHQSRIDHLIVDTAQRIGIGDRARRKSEPHHVAQAVVEMQVGPRLPISA